LSEFVDTEYSIVGILHIGTDMDVLDRIGEAFTIPHSSCRHITRSLKITFPYATHFTHIMLRATNTSKEDCSFHSKDTFPDEIPLDIQTRFIEMETPKPKKPPRSPPSVQPAIEAVVEPAVQPVVQPAVQPAVQSAVQSVVEPALLDYNSLVALCKPSVQASELDAQRAVHPAVQPSVEMDVEEDEEEQEEEEQEEELIVTGPRKAKSAAMCNISRSTVDKRKRGSSDDSDVSDFEDEDYEDEDYKDEDGRQTELQDDEDEDDEDDDPSHVERSVVGAYVAEPAVAEASTTEVADAVAETSNSDGDADDKKKQPRVRHKKKLYKVTKPYETSSASFVPATSEMTPQKEDDAMKYAVAAAPMRATVSLMEEEGNKLKTDNCRTVATNPKDTIPVVPVGVPIANPLIGHVAAGPARINHALGGLINSRPEEADTARLTEMYDRMKECLDVGVGKHAHFEVTSDGTTDLSLKKISYDRVKDRLSNLRRLLDPSHDEGQKALNHVDMLPKNPGQYNALTNMIKSHPFYDGSPVVRPGNKTIDSMVTSLKWGAVVLGLDKKNMNLYDYAMSLDTQKIRSAINKGGSSLEKREAWRRSVAPNGIAAASSSSAN
jgi:hypothetical protein